MARTNRKNKDENQIFNSLRKPVAPPSKRFDTGKKTKERNVKHKKPIDPKGE